MATDSSTDRIVAFNTPVQSYDKHMFDATGDYVREVDILAGAFPMITLSLCYRCHRI